MRPEVHCRVCGYAWPGPPWGADGQSPDYDICPCWDRSTLHDGLTTEKRLAHVPPGFAQVEDRS